MTSFAEAFLAAASPKQLTAIEQIRNGNGNGPDRDARPSASAAVAERLRELLFEKGVTQSQLASALGRHAVWVSRRMTGKTSFLVDDVAEIAVVLDVDMSSLVPGLRRTEAAS